MNLLDMIFGRKKASASVAKERLQIILAHERAITDKENQSTPVWLPQLQQELLDVIAKYTQVDRDALKINLEKRDNIELLEINVTLPDAIEQAKGCKQNDTSSTS